MPVTRPPLRLPAAVGALVPLEPIFSRTVLLERGHFTPHVPTIVTTLLTGATTLESHVSVSTKILNLHSVAHVGSASSAVGKYSTKVHEEPCPGILVETSQWWKSDNH